MWGISPIDQMICRINFKRARYEGPFTPPELGRRNIEYPGYNGGSDWGSVAVDPHRGVIIANYNDMPNYDVLVTREAADAMGLFPAGDPRAAGSASSAEGAGAQTGTPYGILACFVRGPLMAASARSISPPAKRCGIARSARPGETDRSACPPSFRSRLVPRIMEDRS